MEDQYCAALYEASFQQPLRITKQEDRGGGGVRVAGGRAPMVIQNPDPITLSHALVTPITPVTPSHLLDAWRGNPNSE